MSWRQRLWRPTAVITARQGQCPTGPVRTSAAGRALRTFADPLVALTVKSVIHGHPRAFSGSLRAEHHRSPGMILLKGHAGYVDRHEIHIQPSSRHLRVQVLDDCLLQSVFVLNVLGTTQEQGGGRQEGEFPHSLNLTCNQVFKPVADFTICPSRLGSGSTLTEECPGVPHSNQAR